MDKQNPVEAVEKNYNQICIWDGNQKTTIKIEKKYKDLHDEDFVKYLDSLTDNEYEKLRNSYNSLNLLDNETINIYKIVLEDSKTSDLIRSMYEDKFAKLITQEIKDDCRKAVKADKADKADKERECQNKLMPQLYDILFVKEKHILSCDAQTPPIVTQTPPIDTQTPPIVAQGGTRRRRNNKKNKRKTRNNRKKTNRRR